MLDFLLQVPPLVWIVVVVMVVVLTIIIQHFLRRRVQKFHPAFAISPAALAAVRRAHHHAPA